MWKRSRRALAENLGSETKFRSKTIERPNGKRVDAAIRFAGKVIVVKVQLRTDIQLTPLEFAHAPAMCRWMEDPEVRCNIGLRSEPSLAATHAWIEKAKADKDIRAFAIMCNDRHVGNVVLDQIDRHVSNARLSIYVGESGQRGRGVGRTAVALGVRYAFTDLQLHKVWLTVHCHNTAAHRVYEQVGFRVEGILRDEFRLRGQLVDCWRMGILAGEFECGRDLRFEEYRE